MKESICMMIDLVDDATLIAEYERVHSAGRVWPEVVADLRAAGYASLTIWRLGTRMVMIGERDADAPGGSDDPAIIARAAEWNRVMARYQITVNAPDESAQWRAMTRIFDIAEQSGH